MKLKIISYDITSKVTNNILKVTFRIVLAEVLDDDPLGNSI